MTALPALLLTVAAATASFSGFATAQTAYSRGHRPYRSVSRPSLSVAADSGPVGYLLAARSATEAARYVAASEALGRAETQLLNDAAVIHEMPPPFLQRALTDVKAARGSAAAGQRTPTLQAINDALLALEVQPEPLSSAAAITPPPMQFRAPPAQPAPYPVATTLPPPAAVLYRLEPGHWQLRRAQSVWVEAQTVPQPVSVQPVLAPREVWNGDRWVFVPEHFAGTEISQ